MSKAPIRVCVTGAAGQIGYAITPMICNGDMFGPDQPVILHLLDLPFCMESLGGVVMEIEDGNYPLVQGVLATDDINKAFTGCDCAVLLGAFPRKQGMERKDLMEKNIGIFKSMGEAVEKNASANIKVLVVGNPANTNSLIMSHFAPKVPKKNFTAMTRLDHHRAMGQIANKANVGVKEVQNVIIWGNHSSTQFPDVNHGTVGGKPIRQVIGDDKYLNGEFIETIQKRGAAIINARKASSALSAARAAVRHMRSWMTGTGNGEWVSMGVLSDSNGYGVKV
jgi:malate dehydrogenase